ncbi:MAG: hypothetical protein RMN51_08715 [Verrucomicrobiota bacterium]|nr:hypothetical protein [Limisphaera sp.]MDW8382172.1 hypothetical protein [Verrucomicrobiota bacterium]
MEVEQRWSEAIGKIHSCSGLIRLYSCVRVKHKAIARTVTLFILLVAACGGTGCGGFNANVPISPLWFIQAAPPAKTDSFAPHPSVTSPVKPVI